jgi:transposase
MLHARPPRSDCSEHGVRAVKLAWAEASSRFTALLKRLAIDWLHAASQKAVGENLGLSWEAIHGMMERAVSRAERGAVAAAGSG